MKLGEVCDSVSLTFHKLQEKVVLINTSDVFDGKVTNHKYVPNENLRGQFKKSFQQDDILYSEIRPRNRRFAFVDFDAIDYVASTKLMVIRSNGKILPQYLFQVLKSDEVISQLQQLAETRSGTFPQITFSEVAALDVRIPSSEEQRAIAATLSCLDDKIELNNKINANLEAQAQAIFKSWFVDFEPFRDGEFVNSELGPIPKGWRMGTLSEIGTIVGGATPSKAKEEYFLESGQGIAWITPKDLSINKDKFISHGEIDITESGYKSASTKLMPMGSVLFSSRAPIGYMAIADKELCTNQGFKSVVPSEGVGTGFVYYVLKSNLEAIKNLGSGSTFKEVSGAVMNNVVVLIPDKQIIGAFDEICSLTFEKQKVLERENRTLTALRDTLLPKLMSGEIEVPINA